MEARLRLGWVGLVEKGNQLVRAAGSVEKAAESLWQVREHQGLMHLKGVECEGLRGVLHPDLYWSTSGACGTMAWSIGQVYKQISKDIKKHRALVVDGNLEELAGAAHGELWDIQVLAPTGTATDPVAEVPMPWSTGVFRLLWLRPANVGLFAGDVGSRRKHLGRSTMGKGRAQETSRSSTWSPVLDSVDHLVSGACGEEPRRNSTEHIALQNHAVTWEWGLTARCWSTIASWWNRGSA